MPIPLPPLNERKGEKSCPIIPKELINSKRSLDKCGNKYPPRKKGRKPFEKSNKKETKPNFSPRILVIFVAPMLPLPTFLMFIFFILSAIQYPKGIDPYRYVNTQNSNIGNKVIFGILSDILVRKTIE